MPISQNHMKMVMPTENLTQIDQSKKNQKHADIEKYPQ